MSMREPLRVSAPRFAQFYLTQRGTTQHPCVDRSRVNTPIRYLLHLLQLTPKRANAPSENR